MKIKIKGLSFKMKSKIKEHGPWWKVEETTMAQLLVSTLNRVHNQQRYPYSCWVTIGKDVEILDGGEKE